MRSLIGEEETAALLSQFPARDLDEPVTKEFLRAELAGLEVRIIERLRQQTMWMVGTLIAGLGLVSGFAALL